MELETTNPLDIYTFEEIDAMVSPFLMDLDPRKPDEETASLIRWIRRPTPGYQASFIEVLRLANRFEKRRSDRWHLLPWAETVLSMMANENEVFRLDGRCPSCGETHKLFRLFFEAPQCAYLRETRGYLYICDGCGEQVHLFKTVSPSKKDWRESLKGGIRIEHLGLSARTQNCLESVGIETIGELTGWTKRDLEKIRNFGEKSAEEIEEVLSLYGLGFKKSGKKEPKNEKDF